MNDQLKQQFEAKQETNRKIGFDKWLGEPSTRALLSMIPETENKDLVKLILQSAYDSGFGAGSVNATIDLMSLIMKPREPR